MKLSSLHIWVAIAIVEAIVIATLLASRTRVLIRQVESPVLAVNSPLQLALEYDASEEKFEELVRKHPAWVPYRSSDEGADNWVILADCALAGKTNFVRILLRNGADVDVAIADLRKAGADDAIQLVRQVEAEVRPQNAGGRE